MNTTTMTNEELADRLERGYPQAPDSAHIVTEAARRLRAPAWVATAERLPEHGQRVIAMYQGVYGPRIVTFWRDSASTHFGEPPESQPATHWFPCPTPPPPQKGVGT